MKLKKELSRFEVLPLARRYIVMNSFDGVLTSLAIIISSLFVRDSSIVFGAGLAAGLGLAISGISSAYMAERAERDVELERLERAMLSELKMRRAASRVVVFVLAMVNGISPLFAVLAVISPFLFFDFMTALYSSIIICFSLLIVLGIYLAKISNKSMILYGFQMLLTGVVTLILTIGISFLIK